MAINPETEYPGKIEPSSPSYIYGSARNIIVPGDGTGTPWEATIVNDLLGFQQALLLKSGTVPSGAPDTAITSQYFDSLRKLSGLQFDTAFSGSGHDLVNRVAGEIFTPQAGDMHWVEYADENKVSVSSALWRCNGVAETNPVGPPTGTINSRSYWKPSDSGDASIYIENGLGTSYRFVINSDIKYPEMFGAIGDGVVDDHAALTAYLLVKGGRLKAGAVYAIGSTLIIPNRCTMIGDRVSWSTSDDITQFKWIGAADGVMLQVSAEVLGVVSTSSITGINIGWFVLDGDDVAGVGLFGNYVSNECEVHHIAAINCNLFGILASKLWYSKWHDLVARNCDGVGIAFGWNYLSTFDDNSINGVNFENIRAAQCGKRYNVSTAPTGFSQVSNPIGGCGVYLKLKTSSSVTSVLGEGCYGAGVVVDSKNRSRCIIDGVYCEDNMNQALIDGETDLKYGLVIANTESEFGYTRIFGLYLHLESDNNIYYYEGASTAIVYEIDELRGPAEIRSNASSGSSINLSVARGFDVEWTDVNPTRTIDFVEKRTLAAGAGTTSRKGGVVTDAVTYQATNFASGTTLKVGEISMEIHGQARASSVSAILHIGYHAWGGGDQTKISSTYLVNIVAGIRTSTESNAEYSASVVSLGVEQQNLGSNLLTIADPTVTFSEAGDPATVTAEIEVQPTSTGTDGNNSVVASMQVLGGGLRGGSMPMVSPGLEPV